MSLSPELDITPDFQKALDASPVLMSFFDESIDTDQDAWGMHLIENVDIVFSELSKALGDQYTHTNKDALVDVGRYQLVFHDDVDHDVIDLMVKTFLAAGYQVRISEQIDVVFEAVMLRCRDLGLFNVKNTLIAIQYSNALLQMGALWRDMVDHPDDDTRRVWATGAFGKFIKDLDI